MSPGAAAAVAAVRERAQALLGERPGQELALATDFESFAHAKPPTILIGIARPGAAWTMAIAIAEVDKPMSDDDATPEAIRVALLAGWDRRSLQRKA